MAHQPPISSDVPNHAPSTIPAIAKGQLNTSSDPAVNPWPIVQPPASGAAKPHQRRAHKMPSHLLMRIERLPAEIAGDHGGEERTGDHTEGGHGAESGKAFLAVKRAERQFRQRRDEGQALRHLAARQRIGEYAGHHPSGRDQQA